MTILHLSDLHRDPRTPVRNESLLTSLKRDRDRYAAEEEPLPEPQIIVVSGDLVQGVLPDDPDPDSSLRAQYESTIAFLSELCSEFVGGDHHRVVIVPGNHDVSYPHVARSIVPIPIAPSDRDFRDKCNALRGRLRDPHTDVRWSWSDLQFMQVADRAIYLARFAAFSEFYRSFYGSRSYSLLPAEQLDVFEFADLGITLYGLNSCYNNDPLNRLGAFHPVCMAHASDGLRDSPRDLIPIAVWHHSTVGHPADADFMSSHNLQPLIDSGFLLGLHGHQHKADLVSETFRFGEPRHMIVVSAGTLCGGPRALPPGHPRAYNVVVLDPESRQGRVHPREMKNDDFDLPIWGPASLPTNTSTYIDFQLAPPLPASSRATTQRALATAEQLLADTRYTEAKSLLLPLFGTNDLVRRVLLECLVELDDSESIVQYFDPPRSPAETIHLMDALWSQRRRARLSEFVSDPAVAAAADPNVRDRARLYSEKLSA